MTDRHTGADQVGGTAVAQRVRGELEARAGSQSPHQLRDRTETQPARQIADPFGVINFSVATGQSVIQRWLISRTSDT